MAARFASGPLPARNFLIAAVAAVAIYAVWIAYQHFSQQKPVTTYRECVVAGNPVQNSYPETCTTTDGRRFTNPAAQVYQPPK